MNKDWYKLMGSIAAIKCGKFPDFCLMKTNLFPGIFFMSVVLAAGCKIKIRSVVKDIPAAENKDTSAVWPYHFSYVPKGWYGKTETIRGVKHNYLLVEADTSTIIEVVSRNMHYSSLEVFKDSCVKYFRKTLPGAVIVSEGDIKANGTKGLWYNGTFEQSGLKTSIVTYLIPDFGKAYMIAARTKPKDTTYYKPIIDSIIRSFVIN